MFLSVMLISVFSFQSCGSVKAVESKPTEKVIKLDGKTQEDLYIRANTWMVEKFNNAESVIEFSDKPNGIVIGKYLLSVKGVVGSGLKASWKNVYAIIKIQVKDDAAKITITPDSFGEFALDSRAYSGQQAQADINQLVESFSDSIGETETTDWN